MTDAIDSVSSDLLITLTTDIVSAHVSNNSVAVGDVSNLIANVHSALSTLNAAVAPVAVVQEPAVSVRSSVKHDYIICLEDGKKLKMLKRHLMTRYQMTPADYRAKWNLTADYPMTAPAYAQQRKELAVKIGLGRKPRAKVAAPAAKAAGKPRAKKAELVPAE